MTFNHTFITLAVLLLVGATSCSTDFDAYIEGEPTALVYAAINPEDSLYSVRLNKSFVGSGSAYDLAQIEDSIYYQGAQVIFETYRGESLFQSVQLEKVQIEDRDEGPFLNSPNFVYQTSVENLWIRQEVFEALGIDYDLDLRLLVILPDQADTLTASSSLLERPRIISPRFIYKKVYLYGEVPFQMEWVHPVPGNYYEIEVTVHYREVYDSEEIDTVSRWILKGIEYNESTLPGSYNNVYSYFFRPESFYSQLAASIDDTPDVKGRVFQSVDFVVLTVDGAMKDYMHIYNQEDDYRGASYSNIQNGLGLFVTFNETGVYDLELGYRELDSLAFGRYTKHLRFKNWL